MKRRLIHAGILTAVFIVAVFVFSYITNRGNNNMTADLGSATLPSLSFVCEGYAVNNLEGYTGDMDAATMRDRRCRKERSMKRACSRRSKAGRKTRKTPTSSIPWPNISIP